MKKLNTTTMERIMEKKLTTIKLTEEEKRLLRTKFLSVQEALDFLIFMVRIRSTESSIEEFLITKEGK